MWLSELLRREVHAYCHVVVDACRLPRSDVSAEWIGARRAREGVSGAMTRRAVARQATESYTGNLDPANLGWTTQSWLTFVAHHAPGHGAYASLEFEFAGCKRLFERATTGAHACIALATDDNSDADMYFWHMGGGCLALMLDPPSRTRLADLVTADVIAIRVIWAVVVESSSVELRVATDDGRASNITITSAVRDQSTLVIDKRRALSDGDPPFDKLGARGAPLRRRRRRRVVK